jgi:sodium-dependent dicarboxylate transporter 2/3/5
VVWVTFALTIILWVGEQWFKINSNIVAMIPFAVFSATGIMKAKHLEHINWAVLWMVAGGFALGTALNQTGLASTLIKTIPFASWNALVVMLVGGFICYFLSNFISNSASANLVVPILIVVGKAMAGNPQSAESFNALGGVPAMIIGVAICASLAMCLPVSTPPNALAHSTGMITTKQMATVGIVMGAVGLVLGYLMLIFIGF